MDEQSELAQKERVGDEQEIRQTDLQSRKPLEELALDEREIHETDPRSRKPLVQLSEIPVEHEYTDRLLAILEAHGARATPTKTAEYTRRLPEGELVRRTYSEYTIDFPEGTVREYGMFLYRSVSFTIFFPDGYELYCTQVYAARDAGRALNILHIPAQ